MDALGMRSSHKLGGAGSAIVDSRLMEAAGSRRF